MPLRCLAPRCTLRDPTPALACPSYRIFLVQRNITHHKPHVCTCTRLEALLPPWARLVRVDPSRPLTHQAANARVIIPTTGTVCADLIAAAPRLRLIAQPAAGYNNIDVAAARARGIPVTIAPGLNSSAVAECALMMMLMLSRRVDAARAAFGAGVIGEPVGREICGKTLGIVGLGRVGSRLAAAAQGLGIAVMSVNSKSSRAEFEALLRGCDIVSLHCPLTQRTAGLIGAAELVLMRPHAILINCARGSVIDKGALLDALAAGRLGGVGLDTHWDEPADPADPLYCKFGDKMLALPHLGSVTHEVYDRFAAVLAENIVRCREGRPLVNQLD